MITKKEHLYLVENYKNLLISNNYVNYDKLSIVFDIWLEIIINLLNPEKSHQKIV